MSERAPPPVQYPQNHRFPLGDQYDHLSRTFLRQRPTTERCLHDGEKLLPVGRIGCAVPSLANQPLEEMFFPHTQRASRALQAKPAHLSGGIFHLRHIFLHQKWLHLHGNWLSWQWYVPVQSNLLCHHSGNGHSGWGRGAVYCVPIPSLYLDPHLLNYMRIRSKERLHH